MDKNNIQELFDNKISEALDSLRESVSKTLMTESYRIYYRIRKYPNPKFSSWAKTSRITKQPKFNTSEDEYKLKRQLEDDLNMVNSTIEFKFVNESLEEIACKCGCDKPECEDDLNEFAVKVKKDPYKSDKAPSNKLEGDTEYKKLQGAYEDNPSKDNYTKLKAYINKHTKNENLNEEHYDVFRIEANGKETKIDSLNKDELDTFMDSNVAKLKHIKVKRSDGKSVYYASTGKVWQRGNKVQESLAEGADHYSTEILSKLVMMGWHREAGGVSKVYKGVRSAGELSNGDRIVHAEFDPRNRYLIAFLGFDEIMDMDMRDKGDARKAAMEFEKVLATKLKGFKEDLDEDMIDLYLDESTNEEYYIELNEETLEERKIVIRVTSKGKRIKRIKCPPGRVLKNVGGRQVCVTPTGSQRIKKRIAIRKSVRTKKSKGTGYKKRITFKRNRAKRFRKQMGIRSQ